MKILKILKLFPFLLLTSCALFRSHDFEIKKDIVFKTIETATLTGDLYLPLKNSGLRPAVLVVHGGSWTKRAGDMESICRDLANAGFVAFNVTYRLAPASLFPKPVDDIKDAVVWLKENATNYNIDSQKIAAWGYSAGSHLILLAGIDGNLGLKAFVAGGTPADLTAWPQSPLVKTFLGVSMGENPDLWKKASPVNHVTNHSPPVFLYHGAWDDLVEPEQMEKMAQAMKSKNREVETYTVSLLGHIGVYLFSQSSVDRGIDYLKTKLQSPEFADNK